METLNKLIQKQFAKMIQTEQLFVSSISGRDVWNTYLSSFKQDPVFRDPESSVHNCNTCNNFIRRYGNIVAIANDLTIITLFDGIADDEFAPVVKALSEKLKAAPIVDVFFESFNELKELPYEKCTKTNEVFRLGVAFNMKQYTADEANAFGVVKEGEIRKFTHLHLDLPKQFVSMSTTSIQAIQAKYRDKKNVFQRAMKEISLDTLNLVSDLIAQGSLLDGTSHLKAINEYIGFKKIYDNLVYDADNWCWSFTYIMPEVLAKFKNTLIGVLCTELTEGMELNKACENWNKRVDPANYHKATAPITKKQIAEAQKFVEENGYVESFNRRLATIDDIKASEILHLNVGDGNIKSVSIFDDVKATSTQHKRSELKDIAEVSIEKFMKDILPKCTSVEALFSNKHVKNMVSLTTSNVENSKPIFKWSNNYSWTFNGNLAGKSQLAEMVEAKGGRTDGVFRFTHSWNEIEPNQSLMDLHVFFPTHNGHQDGIHNNYGNGNRIGWNARSNYKTQGKQDVDYTSPAPVGYIPVENITFPDIKKMPNGIYVCKIHNWRFRGTGGKGKAEIAFGNEIYQYEYPRTKDKEWVTIAEVLLVDGKFEIDHKIQPTNGSKEIYGIATEEFHKVNLVCLSPNHWGDNESGNKHYMFMLDKCKADTHIRSFHNENLIPKLLKHRKVLEVLGNSSMLESTTPQLSGLGFNSTVKDELIVRTKGSFKRMIKIKF